jgi:hypothetical protein
MVSFAEPQTNGVIMRRPYPHKTIDYQSIASEPGDKKMRNGVINNPKQNGSETAVNFASSRLCG